MRKIIVAELITLDGVIQAPGGTNEDKDGGFAHGGWTLSYWHDDIGAHYTSAAAWRNSTLISGRRTFSSMATACCCTR